MKITKILSIASILSLAIAGSAFATTLNDTTQTVGTPGCSVKPSKNVTITYEPGVSMTGTSGSVSYGIAAIHASGTKTFGSSSADTKMYMKDGISGNTVAAPTVAAGVQTAPTWTSWSAM